MYVVVTTNIKAFQVRNAKHVIYAHQNRNGDLYIGQSECMITRWDQHTQTAESVNHPEYENKFKKAIRTTKQWTHYIIGFANTQRDADSIESAAIRHYNPSLNSHPGRDVNAQDIYGFVPLDGNGREILLERKAVVRYQTQERFSDHERKTIRCKAIYKTGKSHISFECIDDGFRVNISHEKRTGFKAGDIVTISFAAKGKTFYTTTDYSQVSLAR